MCFECRCLVGYGWLERMHVGTGLGGLGQETLMSGVDIPPPKAEGDPTSLNLSCLLPHPTQIFDCITSQRCVQMRKIGKMLINFTDKGKWYQNFATIGKIILFFLLKPPKYSWISAVSFPAKKRDNNKNKDKKINNKKNGQKKMEKKTDSRNKCDWFVLRSRTRIPKRNLFYWLETRTRIFVNNFPVIKHKNTSSSN